MLKKLLKYDFKSVFKYWWIAALTTTVLSVLGGFCMKIIRDANSETVAIEPPTVLIVTAWLAIILCIIALVAFLLLSIILVYVRLYKNFFSDEAYLTFTLPVKRITHLNSKLILGFITEISTLLVCGFDILLMFAIAYSEVISKKAFWIELSKNIKVFLEEADIYYLFMLIEIILGIMLITIFSVLFISACITFASMITKKAKVITAIGIYYGANAILSFVIQMLYLFGSTSIYEFIANLPKHLTHLVPTLMGLVVLLFIAVFCCILYAFEYWMLDRKLNLA